MVSTLRDSNVEQLVQGALADASRALSGPETTVCIDAVDPENTFVRDVMGGVTGITVGTGKIWVQIFPEGQWAELEAHDLLAASEYNPE